MPYTEYKRALRGAYPGTLEANATIRNGLPYGLLTYGAMNVSTEPQFDNPTFQAIDTPVTDAETADGHNWSQARPIVFDSAGNAIINVQHTGPRNVYAWFDGTVWHDNAAIVDFGTLGEIGDRWTFIYDEANDCLHAVFTAGTDGPIYRRYDITRVGDAIVSIDWDRATTLTNAVLDDGGDTYAHPICLQHGNFIYALYNILVGTKSEYRAMRVDIGSNLDAGGTVANWVHIGHSDTTALGIVPNSTSYTILATVATAVPINPSAVILDNGDLCTVYFNATRYVVRRMAGGTLGAETVLSLLKVSGSDTGYTLKTQLISKIVTLAGVQYVALPVWLNNTDGDSVLLFAINGDNTFTSTVVYSAGGAHSYAPTFDIALLNGRIVVTYLKTGGAGTFIRAYNADLTPATDELLVFDTFDSDIPLIADDLYNGKAFITFREAGSPPQPGYYGFVDYA